MQLEELLVLGYKAKIKELTDVLNKEQLPTNVILESLEKAFNESHQEILMNS